MEPVELDRIQFQPLIVMNPMPFRQFVSTREPGTLGVGRGLACIVSATILLTAPVKVVAADKPKAEAITFKDHVKPILRQYCLKCHGNDEQNADLNLQTYATLLKGGSGGAVVKPGRPEASVLFEAITATDDAARMPPKSPPLPAKHIQLIRRWIATGLRETRVSKSLAPAATITFNPSGNAAMKPTGPPAMPAGLAVIKRAPNSRRLPVLAMAASPWAPLLAVSAYQHVRLFDITTRKEIGSLPFPEGIPQVLRFSRNGGVLLVAGGKPVQVGSVVLFDVRTGKRVAQLGDELDAVMSADISPDQRLVGLGGSGRTVKVYSTADGRLKYKLTRHTDWITALAFSPDGKQFASGDRAGGLHLWNTSNGGLLFSLSSHRASIRTISWRSDGKVLASGSEDGRLIWWNTETGFTSISNSNPHPPQRPGGVFGKLPNGVLGARFGTDGNLLTCGRDGHARFWDVSGRQLRTFKVAAAIPIQVAISHDGKTLVAGDSTGQVHFWARPR